MGWAQESQPETDEMPPSDGPAPLILEQPPTPFEPREPLSAEDADRLEAETLFATGRLFEQRGRSAEALRYFQRALRYDPESLVILREIVPLAFRLERMGEAIRYALKIVEKDPTDPLLPRLGEFLIERGDIEQAVELFEKSLEAGQFDKKSSQYVALMARMGDLYYATESYEKAADAFAVIWDAIDNPDNYDLVPAVRRVLTSQPAATYQRFGETFLFAKRFDEARRAFDRSQELEANAPLLAFRRAQILAGEDKPEQAIDQLNAYFAQPDELTIEKGSPVELLAELYEKTGKSDQLLAKLESIHKAYPKQAEVGYALADAYRKAEQWDKAEAIYKPLLEIKPTAEGFAGLTAVYKARGNLEQLIRTLALSFESPDARNRNRGLLGTLGAEGAAIAEDPELARKLLETGEGLLAKDADSLGYGGVLVLGHLAAETGEPEKADKFFQAAVDLKTEDEEKLDAYQEWLAAALAKERYTKSAEILETLIEDGLTEAGNLAVLYQLSGILEMDGRTEEAIKTIDQALETRPGLGVLAMRKAWIYYHANRYDDAIREYSKVIELHEGTEDAKQARMILSAIHVTTGNIRRGEELLEQVLDAYPDDVTAHNDLGYLWADQNKNLERAMEMIQYAVDAEPDNQAFRDSLAWVLFRLERYEEALLQMRKAIELDTDDVDGVLWDHMGDIYLANDQRTEAIESWKKAIRAFEASTRLEPGKLEAVKKKIVEHGGATRPEGDVDPEGEDTP
jgi:tetratricopeptide (TPR) repeat protein